MKRKLSRTRSLVLVSLVFLVMTPTTTIGSIGESYNILMRDIDLNAHSQIWLLKTDSLGNTSWMRTIGNKKNWYYPLSVRETEDGGFVISGAQACRTCTFWMDCEHSYFVIKTDKYGYFKWKWVLDSGYTVGSPTSDSLEYVKALKEVTTPEGEHLDWAVIGEMGITSAPSGGILVLGQDNTNICLIYVREGDTLWKRTYGRAGMEFSQTGSIEPVPDGGYIIAGRGCRSMDDGVRVWLIKIDAKFNLQWKKEYGYPWNHYSSSSVWPTSDGGYIVVAEKKPNKRR